MFIDLGNFFGVILVISLLIANAVFYHVVRTWMQRNMHNRL